jgi:hypothetical protein
LSGKELFSYNASLFIDDDSAFDTTNDNTINAEIKALAEQEEKRIKEETERAQAEQMRLAEAQKLEIEIRQQKQSARAEAARAKDHKSFLFNGLIINQIVFEDDEDEDLELFGDEEFAPKSNNYEIEDGIEQMQLNEEDNEAGENTAEGEDNDEEGGEDGEDPDDGES